MLKERYFNNKVTFKNLITYLCVNCGSCHVIKDGFIKKGVTIPIQRYRCMKCGFKTTVRIDIFRDWGQIVSYMAYYDSSKSQQFKEPYQSFCEEFGKRYTKEQLLKWSVRKTKEKVMNLLWEMCDED